MASARSSASCEQAKTERPGGSASAFCTPASSTSMPSLSISIGTAENEDTEATTKNTPVEVSLWISVTRSKPPSASLAFTAAGEIASPHSTCTLSA